MGTEVKVGAFALGGAIALAGIITFMGAFSFGKKGYELRIDYPQVSGLMPGHVVRYAGVQVGTVKKLNVGSFLENRAFRMEEGEGVLNKTLKTKTTFSNMNLTDIRLKIYHL